MELSFSLFKKSCFNIKLMIQQQKLYINYLDITPSNNSNFKINFFFKYLKYV